MSRLWPKIIFGSQLFSCPEKLFIYRLTRKFSPLFNF